LKIEHAHGITNQGQAVDTKQTVVGSMTSEAVVIMNSNIAQDVGEE
jgi:hypothetical protein